ncbi:MAG: hypothetical protein EU530_10480 [Promethearchaeota archaeon]|nr:MAG: hypothetical protein EU530_10480 [Candidatus Lokiarchaeota archaeon]
MKFSNRFEEDNTMVEYTAWINDGTGSFLLFFGIIMGIILILRYKESRAIILLYLGFTCINVGLIYFIFFLRFLSHFPFLTIENIFIQTPPNGSYIFVALSTYAWIGPAVTGATYLGTELLVPRILDLEKIKKTHHDLKENSKESINRFFMKIALTFKIKKPRLLFHIPAWILLIVWECLIFLGPNSWLNPITETELIGDTSFQIPSPPFSIMMFYALYLVFFLVIGFLFRAIKTGGVMEEKFVILSLGMFLMILELVFEGMQDVGESISFALVLRILMVIGLMLLNYGMTPSKKKKKNKKLPTEVAKLAYYVIGDTEELDDQFWDLYIKKSKEMIDEYKEEKKKDTS